jgi:hypothetical protein
MNVLLILIPALIFIVILSSFGLGIGGYFYNKNKTEEEARLQEIKDAKDTKDKKDKEDADLAKSFLAKQDSCNGYTDASVDITDNCLEQLWKKQKCTTPITFSDQGRKKWKSMNLKDIKDDMYGWSHNLDIEAKTGCYGIISTTTGGTITSTITPTEFKGDRLHVGEYIKTGQGLQSSDQVYTLTMNLDGNLVLKSKYNENIIWQTNTKGQNAELTVDSTGNITIKNNDELLWQSNTAGTNCTLVLQFDGNLILMDDAIKFKWSKNNKFFDGNNGTVSGDTYCKGVWGSTTDKNMRCSSGKNVATGKEVTCDSINIQNPLGDFGYQCVPMDKI